MANVKGGVSDDLKEYIPNVCTNSPAYSQAFCKQHCEIVTATGYKTGLRDFLKSCASEGEDIDPNNYTKDMQAKVETVLQRICNNIPASSMFKTCVDAQGTVVYSSLSIQFCCRNWIFTTRS